MSWYSVSSADCKNVLTVEYCVPKGVLYIAYVLKLLLAIIGLPKEVIFLCVWYITCKMLLYARYDCLSLNHTRGKWNEEHPSIFRGVGWGVREAGWKHEGRVRSQRLL